MMRKTLWFGMLCCLVWANAAHAAVVDDAQHPTSGSQALTVSGGAVPVGSNVRQVASGSAEQAKMEADFKDVIAASEMHDFDGFAKGAAAFRKAHPNMPTERRDELIFTEAALPMKKSKYEEAMNGLGELVINKKLCEKYQALAQCEYAKAMQHYGDMMRIKDRAQGEKITSESMVILKDLITTVTLRIDKAQGTERLWMEEVLLDALYSSRQFPELVAMATKFLAEHPKPTREWAVDMFWIGVGNVFLKPHDLKDAVAAFREIVEASVNDTHHNNEHLPSVAASWGSMIARVQNDNSSLNWYLEKIKQLPDSPAKKSALERYSIR